MVPLVLGAFFAVAAGAVSETDGGERDGSSRLEGTGAAADAGVAEPAAGSPSAATDARFSLLAGQPRLTGPLESPLASLWARASWRAGSLSAGGEVLLTATSALSKLSDTGSNVWLGWRWRGAEATDGIRIALHPFGGSRLRLGTAEPIRLPLHPLFGPGRRGAAAVEVRWGAFDAFLWGEAVNVLNDVKREEEVQLAVATGVRWKPSVWGASVSGMSAPYGVVPGLASQNISAPVGVAGLRAAAFVQTGGGVAEPVDFEWHANNPERWGAFFGGDDTDAGRALQASVEGAFLSYTTASATSFGDTVSRPVLVGAALGSVRLGRARGHVRAVSRSFDFIVLPIAGFPPFMDPGPLVRDERSLRLDAEYAFGPGEPRIGVGASLTSPATFRASVPGVVPATTLVVRDYSRPRVLPLGIEPGVILAGRLGLTWQPMPAFAVASAIAYEHDPNVFRFETEPNLQPEPRWSQEAPGSLRVDLLLQLRL